MGREYKEDDLLRRCLDVFNEMPNMKIQYGHQVYSTYQLASMIEERLNQKEHDGKRVSVTFNR